MTEPRPIITEEQAEQFRRALAEAFQPVADAAIAMASAYAAAGRRIAETLKQAAHPEG